MTTRTMQAPVDARTGAARQQHDAAAARVAARGDERGRKIEAIRSGGQLAVADTPERVVSRIDRLSHYYPDVRPISPEGVLEQDKSALELAGKILERVIDTPDFVGIGYLEAGARAARAVGRIDIRDERGRVVGYGTGSMVSPRLLLTNNHVLPDPVTAAASAIEFSYEDGIDGRPLQPRLFALDPETFFLTDEELDFSLVAVGRGDGDLGDFGHNPLIGAEGKAIAGDFVSIPQHPGGEKKQIALRDNRVVDVFDDFLHYQADTEPGSSGSPVFNDQWEIVALHHAGVPAPEHTELGGYVNEGIRVSRLLQFIGRQQYPPAKKALLDGLPAPEAKAPPDTPVPSPGVPLIPGSVTVPLEVTVRVADGGAARATTAAEAVRIDPDYRGREGYDPEFLGTGALAVPLPTLSAELVPLAAVNTAATSEPSYVLPYHHFSIVQNRQRRLAFFTAVNIDGALGHRLRREPDHWIFDPRVRQDEQTGTEVYADNDLDLGHLVRRLDPAWGVTDTAAKKANDDTFHLTNCTPQHKDFNRDKTLWAGVEEYILESAENRHFRVDVFTGPVFAADDDTYKNVQLPRQFWKVVAMAKQDGTLSATAYLLSQEALIKGLEIGGEDFSYGAYGTYQVPVSRIEQLTGLSFGSLEGADPLAQREEEATIVEELDRLEAIRL